MTSLQGMFEIVFLLEKALNSSSYYFEKLKVLIPVLLKMLNILE